MRVPPLYNDKSWQRFFAGLAIGIIFGWLFFLYHFGLVHEKLVLEINRQKTTIEHQEQTIEVLRKDQDEINEQNQKQLTVQDIHISFVNEKDVKLSELTYHELKGAVEGELEVVRNKDIDTIAGSKDFLLKTVENKIFIIGEKRYQLKVEQLILYTALEMYLRITPAE
ncbi:hypothetical protein MM300_03320 [Evansella sp. LMS18]|uniref:sporulation membrane protein YtrI n=1 Tax=Evansella sp. LMS18 TaxID=2924033 RepID=UPI0020D1CA8E|nr:sporulation membrane protein YtrI [Evansella sp. LMS18]UTR11374.1 hypothetical protein MM300_03320 [Evansella sp. LMS18]